MVYRPLPWALPGFFNPYGESHLGAVLLVVMLVILVLRLRPAVRRRVLLLSTPVAGAVLLVQTEFQGFIESPHFTVYLTFGQWAALVVVPLLVFTTSNWLLHRYERKLASGALLT
jgi:FtsH-binding integral membrane protein